jgi:hypothetical protein
LISGDVPAEVTILNSPPYLLMSIPDQAWPENSDLLNAFDLDDYFTDPNGDTINYTYAPIGNITIFINPITNEVSFYPLESFIGEETTTFYARDSVFNISSNPVLLSVGLDNVSPTWSSPTKSKATIFQNDFINFSTIWKDNVALNNYIFSINQGNGWSNLSSVAFSGTQNNSRTEIQISAPVSNQVFWKFYAWDTSGNMNFTDTQSFIVSSASSPSAPPSSEEESSESESDSEGDSGIISDILEDIPLIPQRKLKDFRLNIYDFKLSLKQGSSKTVVLKITNLGTEGIFLNLSDLNLWNFVVFSEKSFELLPGNSKEITIDFDIPKNAFVGQYYGFIKIDSGEVNKTVPVVLDIQGIDLDFEIDLLIPENYKTTKPGEEVQAVINIFNIKDISDVNASFYYAIKDFTGGVYNFSEEEINFTYSTSLNRSLEVPLEINEGKYIFYARISDEKNIAIDSEVFEIGKKFTMNAFLKSNGIFLILIMISLFLAIFMVKYQRDKRKERLINLYITLLKLKKLIQNNKQEEALQLFLRIRNEYKEPVSQEILKDKEKLRQELLKLYESINPEALKKIKEEIILDNAVQKKTINASLPLQVKAPEQKKTPPLNLNNPLSATKNSVLVSTQVSPSKILKKENTPNVIKKTVPVLSNKKEDVKNDK